MLIEGCVFLAFWVFQQVAKVIKQHMWFKPHQKISNKLRLIALDF